MWILLKIFSTIFLTITFSNNLLGGEGELTDVVDLSESITKVLEHQLPLPKIKMSTEEIQLYYDHSKLKKKENDLNKIEKDKDCDKPEEQAPPSPLAAIADEICNGKSPVKIGFLMRVSGRKSNRHLIAPTSYPSDTCEITKTGTGIGIDVFTPYVKKKNIFFPPITITQNCDIAINDFVEKNDLTGLSLNEIKNLFKDSIISVNNQKNLKDLIAKAYLSQSTSDDQLKRRMVELSKGKNFEEKMNFITQILGFTMHERWDKERNDKIAEKGKGIAKCLDILKNLKNDKINKAGVCRDIAICQVKLAKSAGINCKGVGYRTKEDGHVTVVCYDPDNPRVIHKINYGERLVEDGVNGPAGLSQDHGKFADIGIQYLIYDHNGKGIATLPSELGTILHEQLGGNSDELMPLIDSPSNISSVDFDFGKYACGLKSSFFTGTLSNGDIVQGIAFSKKISISPNDNKNLGEIGVKIGATHAEVIKQNMQVKHLYQQINFFMNSPVLLINNNLRIWGDLNIITIRDDTSTSYSDSNSYKNREEETLINTGIYANYKSDKTTTHFSYKAQTKAGRDDNRDDKSDLHFYNNWETYNLGFSREIDSTLAQNMMVVGDFVHLRNQSAEFYTNKTSLGVEKINGKYGIMISRTLPNTPTPYMPSGTDKTDLSLYYQLDDNLKSSIFCDQYQGETSAQCTLQLSGKW